MTPVLMDSNILLRSAQPSHPMHQEALDAQRQLRQHGEQPCIVTQNLIEFRAVATRPASVNGLGMTQQEADAEIHRLKVLYRLFLDEPTILAAWEQLVSTYGAEGKQNHDARLVVAMQVHGIGKVSTFNKSDFVRYPGIVVVTPSEVLSAAP